MADQEATFRLKFENEDMIKVFDQMIDRNEQVTVGLKDLEDRFEQAFNAGVESVKKSDKALKGQAATLDVNKVRFKGLKDVAEDAMREIENRTGAAGGALARFGRAAGPIGAAVASAVGLISAAWLDVKENANAAKREMEGIKAVGNELKTRVFAAIRGIGAAFNNAALAALEFNTALGKGRDSLADIQQQGREFFDLQDRIAKANRSLIRSEAEKAVQVQRLNALASDGNKTTAERIELIRNAAATEASLNNDRIAQLTNEISVRQAENKLYGEQEGSLDAIANLEAELIETRGANSVIAIQTQQQINALLQEEAEIRARIIKQLRDFIGLASGTQAENAVLNQIQAFEELRDSISSAGLAEEYAGELQELDRVISGLYGRLEAGLVKPLEQLRDKSKELLVESLSGDILGDELEKGAREAMGRLTKAYEKELNRSFNDLTEDQQRFLEDSLKDILGSAGEIIAQDTQIQINQQAAIIDSRQDNISELERQLAEQERLNAQGIANQSSRLRQSLQEERNILKREQERRLALEKKAATQRLISNSIQQGSEITLAAAKLLKEGSSGFIPGLIAAAGGIALLFRIIAQAKANAAAFAAPPQFREGTEYLSGPSHERGGIPIEVEGGERILSRALNEQLGGRRLSNEELVDFALMGMTAQEAIGPMAAAIASGSASRRQVDEIEAWERNEVLAQVFRDEIRDLKDEMRNTIRERPAYYPTDQAGRREFYRGNVKIVEKIVPK